MSNSERKFVHQKIEQQHAAEIRESSPESAGSVPDLPPGYKERMDKSVIVVMDEAKRIMEICNEFECETVEFGDGTLSVVIKPTKEGK